MQSVISVAENFDLAVARAVDTLVRGHIVALPTETVYGLAGDSTNPVAVAAIYEAKRRSASNPLISHVGDVAMAERYVDMDEISHRLATRFWPGPLTLVLPLKQGSKIDRASTARLPTAGVRAPRGIANDIIRALDKPVAAPSANISGRVSPTTARHVIDDLSHRVPLVIDGGPCQYGIESTVVTVRNGRVLILRPGAITLEDLRQFLGVPILDYMPGAEESPISPGLLTSHYAPRSKVRLNALSVAANEALLTFSGEMVPGSGAAALVLDLSVTGDLSEAAANLYDMMKRADSIGAQSIAVVPIANDGIGKAINDRLRRAAAPR